MKKIDAKTQSLPWWKKPVSSLKGIGPKKAIEFEGLGIVTIGDLLNHFPRQGCYLDYSHVKTIRELTLDGSMQLFRGQIARIIKRRSARNMRYASVVVSDGTAFAEIFLFGAQVYAVRYLENGDDVLVIGKVGPGRTAKAVTQAVISKVKDEHPEAPGILPTYALSGSLTQKNVRSAVRQALLLAKL